MEAAALEEEAAEVKPYMDKNLSAAQLKDREKRTIFIGNIPLDSKRKTLKTFFGDCGAIEQVWVRSVPIDRSQSKMSIKGSVILKNYIDHSKCMNAYMSFASEDSLAAALLKNGSEYKGRHIVVTMANQKQIDHKTTIFVGNLPFSADEEDIRAKFASCGNIEYVRMIRDKHTHRGKGVAYIKFDSTESYLKGLKMNKAKFGDREMRVNKALLMGKDGKPVDKKEAKPRWDEERKAMAKEMKKKNSEAEILAKKELEERVAAEGGVERWDMEEEIVETEIGMENRASVPMSKISKQIKKIKKKGLDQTEAVRQVNKVQKRAHKRLDEDIFNKGDMMKKRREDKKKQAEVNAKKAQKYRNLINQYDK